MEWSGEGAYSVMSSSVSVTHDWKSRCFSSLRHLQMQHMLETVMSMVGGW